MTAIENVSEANAMGIMAASANPALAILDVAQEPAEVLERSLVGGSRFEQARDGC
jgi:hypothetical protein